MKTADNKTWNDMFNIFMNESNSKILRFLACAEDPTIICNYIKTLAFSNFMGNVTDSDHINSFYFIVARHAKNDAVLEYILENFVYVKPR